MMNNTSVTKLSLIKWVFLHLFIVFLMSISEPGDVQLQYVLQCSQSLFVQHQKEYHCGVRVTELGF